MKAMRLHDFGGTDSLWMEDVTTPVPRPGKVLVRQEATSVNPADWKAGEGLMRHRIELPAVFTPGLDVAGTVEAVGDDVHDISVGDRVIGSIDVAPNGSYADYVVAKADRLVAAPAELPLADAAALPTASIVAWGALFGNGLAEVTSG